MERFWNGQARNRPLARPSARFAGGGQHVRCGRGAWRTWPSTEARSQASRWRTTRGADVPAKLGERLSAHFSGIRNARYGWIAARTRAFLHVPRRHPPRAMQAVRPNLDAGRGSMPGKRVRCRPRWNLEVRRRICATCCGGMSEPSGPQKRRRGGISAAPPLVPCSRESPRRSVLLAAA